MSNLRPHQSNTVSIIIPVYNEGANFSILWKELTRQVACEFKAYVVYDFDGDDTVPVANKIIEGGDTRLKLIKNNIKRGVVGAVCTGFNSVDSGPVLVVMADLSDDLSIVTQMLKLYNQGYDVIVGSRYVKGGRLIGGPVLKQSMSRVAGLSLHWLRRIPTTDATNAFKMYDREMLRDIVIESNGGFELNLEITVKAFLAGYKITEIPSTWTDRTAGTSKFKLWSWLPSYLKWYLYAFRPRSIEHPATAAVANSHSSR
jgi:glycosyltransferase involved in cell wall biosynthesis